MYNRAKSNSVNQIVNYLKNNPYKTETEIQEEVFGYYRSTSYLSNKKYAEMLRRGLHKGLYSRTTNEKGRYVYYLPTTKVNNTKVSTVKAANSLAQNDLEKIISEVENSVASIFTREDVLNLLKKS